MTDIKNVGYEYVEPSNFVLDKPDGTDYLFLLTRTPAFFWVNGEIKEYPPYSAVLFHPQQKVYYRAFGDNFINDWIRFTSNESFITATTLPRGVPFSLQDPDYCSKLVQLIFKEKFLNNGENNYKGLSIDYLLMILFNKLIESYHSVSITPQYHKLLKLRASISNNAGDNWTVEKMADLLHISPGYLQSLYKASFGISCMDDVINSRIRVAKEYLIQRNCSVSETAGLCGYNNVEHFSRQFKQITGSTPSQYRSNATNSTTAM